MMKKVLQTKLTQKQIFWGLYVSRAKFAGFFSSFIHCVFNYLILRVFYVMKKK